jgi:hypothetical protein
MLYPPGLPSIPFLGARCQRLNVIGHHSLVTRARGGAERWFDVRAALRRLVGIPAADTHEPVDPLGEPSRFAEGDWVRVRDKATVRQTLDAQSRLAGVPFALQQSFTCGKVFRVMRRVRRIMDDTGKLLPVHHAVLLEGLDCEGESGADGCGRHCPLMYRDEWLEPWEPQRQSAARQVGEGPFVFVRSIEEILRRLDMLNQTQGLLFMPEMARFAEPKPRVVRRRLSRILEFGRWLEVPFPIYILDGLHCSGAILGSDGPCDRACPLLWHGDWIDDSVQSQTVRPPGGGAPS